MKNKKSFIVIGLGRFGLAVIKTLSELKADILAIDVNEDCVTLANEYTDACVIGDATKINVLKEIGVSNIDHAVVAIGNNLQATILTTINLKELGVKKITVRVDDEQYKSVMERLGATDTIIPEEASAISLANHILSDNVLDYYKVTKDYSLVQMKLKHNINATLIDMDVRNKFDINVVGIIRDELFFIPKGSDKMIKDDVVLVVGLPENIVKFDSFINNNSQ